MVNSAAVAFKAKFNYNIEKLSKSIPDMFDQSKPGEARSWTKQRRIELMEWMSTSIVQATNCTSN